MPGKGRAHPVASKRPQAVATGSGAIVGKAKNADYPPLNPLTPRQQRFVDEYLVDLNATQAAIRAGYSAKTAEQQGPRLLGNVGVGLAIEAGKQVRSKETGITQARVLEELALLAFSDVATHYLADDAGNVTLAHGAPEGALRAISSIKRRFATSKDGETTCDVEIKLWDKPGTLKLAGRHVGTPGFFDKVEVTGKDGAPIEFARIERVVVRPKGGA